MLNPEIHDSERLYRAIKVEVPNQWNANLNRPSSAAFKDSNGASVDRDGGRSIEQVIVNLQNRFNLRAIISVTAEECRNINTYPKAAPEPNNSFHALILRNSDQIQLTQSQAKKLRDRSRIDFNRI